MAEFKIGDIVVHKENNKVYQIYKMYPRYDNRYCLERFNNDGVRCTSINVSPNNIRIASDTEKSEFYRLKELHEIKEKLDITLKEDLNKVYGVNMNFAELYPTSEQLSKELMEFKKAKEEKETNNMRKFKIGDIVEHWNFGEGTVIGYEKYSKILVKFKDYDTKDCVTTVIYEDTCHLVASVEELHDLCGRRPIPKFKQVIYNNPATIIFWEDGTKTVVKCDGTRTITLADGTTKTVKTSEGEKYDELKGLMMGIVKKVYGFKKFYNIYENTTKYVTGNKTLLNIEKGLAESVIKDLYGIKNINSKDDIYKVAMTDGFYVSTERK